MSGRAPVLFLSHGAPPLADDPVWTRELAQWSAGLAKPASILMVSAHWEAAPVTLSSTTGAPLLYDFWGFPSRYYQVRYAAPPAPELAATSERLLTRAGLATARDETRGLDHGGYVPLVEMYPEADVPVVQLSLPTLDPRTLFAVGELLAPLRDQGTMIVGSGFTTHNLAWFRPSNPSDGPVPSPSAEFDQWAADAMAAQDVDALLDFARKAPAARLAHPRTEHWAPLYVALGAAYADGSPAGRSVIDGFWYGLSKRSWQLD
ncbi:MAG: DODA-type extradiol aromatic ring-opening family dioxygenase [Dermatophilaceae bacterium]